MAVAALRGSTLRFGNKGNQLTQRSGYGAERSENNRVPLPARLHLDPFMLSRASTFGLLLTLFTSLSISAQESVQEGNKILFHEASHPHGDNPHAGIAADTSALPLEGLANVC